jgi:hypothetical protein
MVEALSQNVLKVPHSPSVREEPMPSDTEPKPCDKFQKMKLTKEFVAHLPACKPCRAALAKIGREFQPDASFIRDLRTH